MKSRVAVIGSGPAGLMAADVLARAGHSVSLFEKRKGPAWKLYIAGGSGLNISHALPLDRFAAHYTGPLSLWQDCLKAFGPEAWLGFIEKDLGLRTFLGTSHRYFVEDMHAAKLVRQWRRRLEAKGVAFYLDHLCQDFEVDAAGLWRLYFLEHSYEGFAGVIFALGGASYEAESPAWPAMFSKKGLACEAFLPSNTGYEVAWPEGFIREAEGLPLKNISLTSARGQRRGDLVITAYGLEGTPIYFLGETGPARLDLKPDLTISALRDKLMRGRENLSPLRRAQKNLGLHPAAQALLFHLGSPALHKDPELLLEAIKSFPLTLLGPRPLSESISSRGGLSFEGVDENLMLRTCPGVYAAGEMLAWDAPTGGFLIQACVSQGYWAASQFLARSANQS